MKLSKGLLKSIQRYYMNREKQNVQEWNKQADLKAIFKEAFKTFNQIEACAGTFFLTKKYKRKVKTFRIDEESFPNTEVFVDKPIVINTK